MSVLGHGSKSTSLNRTYAKGEKCATALFTETDVGNDTPKCFLDKFFFFCFKIKYERANAPLGTFTPLTFLL